MTPLRVDFAIVLAPMMTPLHGQAERGRAAFCH